ncbi:MAG: hypothetical protein V8T48_10030, partial [Oscillospiraceae bacterium]
MKKVFLGLTAATILYAIYNVIIDIRDGVFDGLTIVGLLFLLLVAGVFGFLAWLFDGKSPVKRTAEQAKNVVKQEQEKFDAYVGYSACHQAADMEVPDHWSGSGRAGGVALYCRELGYHPGVHCNRDSDYRHCGVQHGFSGGLQRHDGRRSHDRHGCPRKIEEFYRAFQNEKTPLGSAYLGKFSTSPYTSLIFGPNVRGEFLYFYLNRDGMIGYVGYSMLDSTISERLTEPRFPAEADA